MKNNVVLTHKDYMLSLRFSLFRLIELYGENALVDAYVNNSNNKLLSLVVTPGGNNYHKTQISLIRLLVYTIKYTNSDFDERLITLRVYRYIRKQSYEDVALILGIKKEEYESIEMGYNPFLLEKLEKQLSLKLEINFSDFKDIRI